MMIVDRHTWELHLDTLYPLIPQGQLRECAKQFRTEIIAALSNQRSSLPAILNPVHRVKPKKGFGVAVSIGGTNGYVSAFRISKRGEVAFLNRKIFSIPSQTSKNTLFHLIGQNILAVTKGKKQSFPIGIGFAYPLKPASHDGLIDGELIRMTKEREIKGLVGTLVGQEFHLFLKKEYKLDTTVNIINDTIALLIGGDGADVAGVVGTGMNFAYWERRLSVAPLKLIDLPGFSQGELAVNLESANFDKIPQSKLGKIIDVRSDIPGRALAEKEAAGAYLYQIFNAGKNELLGKGFPQMITTDQLNDILTGAYVYPPSVDKDQKMHAKQFTERIYHRSAQVVAIELSGILMKLGKTKGIVTTVMEGGIFWKAYNYPALVNLYVNMILPEVILSFARLFGSSRRGIAIFASGY